MTRNALPESPLGQKLWDVFGRYPWSWIKKPDGKDCWQTEKRYPLRPRLLWKHWQDAGVQVGVRFGSMTRYCLLDIDKKSAHLKASAIAEIKEALETVGIVRTVDIRSSYSGGIHIYCPLPEPVNTFNLAVAVRSCLEAHGFTIEEGQLEVFPNTKAFGRSWLNEFVEYQGHRLPLQPGSGSVILNHNFQPVGDNLDRFWWSWDFAEQAQDLELLFEALGTAKRNRRKSKKMLSNFLEWKQDLEQETAEGWTDFGQTNHLLKQFGCYGRVFLQLQGEALAKYIEERARSAPGFEKWCQHQHEIARKAICWARSVEHYYWPAGSEGFRAGQFPTAPESANVNKERQWDAQQRIANAVAEIEATMGKAVRTVSEWLDAIQMFTRISTRTLYKHRELWHPRCKKPIDTSYLNLLEQPQTEPEESNPETPQPSLINGFLHLGGGMKSLATEISIRKTNPQGGEGVARGRGGFSTGVEGV